MTDFQRALKFTLGFEGGYVNDPDDPGGETNKGITARTLDAYCRRVGIPTPAVKTIDDGLVAAIYETDYWRPAKCDGLRWPLCLIHFDTAVNIGVSRAAKMLELSKNDASMYLHERRNYYTALANQKPAMQKFLQGWLNRCRLLGNEVKS